jgi:acylphosphatase
MEVVCHGHAPGFCSVGGKEVLLSRERAIVATVSGRVQGVGFRYSTQRVGTNLGLRGWVMNQPDGTVRTWAQGAEESVTRFLGFLEEGPPSAEVVTVRTDDVTVDTSLTGFRVRY